MARASNPYRLVAYEPFYHRDPQTGGTIEIFYAHSALAESFGSRAGWHWWIFPPDRLPDGPPRGPFATGYRAYFDAMGTPDFGLDKALTNKSCPLYPR